MINVSLYSLTLIAITIYCIKSKKNVMGTLLWTIYSIIGVFSLICVNNGMLQSYLRTDVIPYLYLVVVYAISFWPYINRNGLLSKKMRKELYSQYYLFSYIYILAATVTIALYIRPVKDLFISGNWLDNIENMYTGEIVFPYNNIIEYICIQFAGYTRMIALLIGFAMLRNIRDMLKGAALVLSAIGSGILTALYISSRGAIVNIIVLVIALYSFFSKEYSKKVKVRTTIAIGVIVTAIIPIMSAITISRFTDKKALDSVLQYFGQAPIVFSGGVFNISKYSFGVNGFGTFLGRHISQVDVGGSWGSGFYTYVGWLLLDWGPIGTLIVCGLISFIMWYLIQKEEYELSDVYIVFFTYYTLIQGVFVIGTSYCYHIVVALLIYVSLKIFSDNKVYYAVNTLSERQIIEQHTYLKDSKSANISNNGKYIK